MARLRIGHAGVNSHLYRFRLKDSPLCSCGEEETIDHYFLICPDINQQRQNLCSHLLNLGVPMNIQNVLGGGNFDYEKQKKILNGTLKYLRDTNKLESI